MTKEREALKLALEALEKYARDFGSSDLSVKAMYVVRQALANHIPDATKMVAQPEQEPIQHCEAGPEYCWKCNEEMKLTYGSEEIRKLREVNKRLSEHIEDNLTMVAQPQEQEPLTDEQINEIADEFIVNYRIPAGSHYDFVRAIETAHGIKE